MMNKTILIGRLTRDAELRYTSSNKAYASFSLAVQRDYKNTDGNYDSDFINIAMWGQIAETVNKYTHKGDLIAVSGRLQTRTYENNEAKKVYVTEVIADKVTFLQQKKEDNKASVQEEKQDNDPFEEMGKQVEAEIDDNDLPF